MTDTFLVTGATGETGRYTVQRLLEKGHAVRAMVHRQDERADALRSEGAEVVVGDLFEHDDVIRAAAGATSAYFCYPVRPGIIQTTAYFADAAKRAGLKAVINMSQISAREDSKSHAARDHWIAERIFDWSGVPTIHLRPTFFSQWLLYPFARKTIVEQSIIDLPYGAGRHAPIAAEDQARLIATLLAEPAAHIGKTYTLHGPTELDQPGIAAAISEVLGRKISYQPLTIPAYRDRLEKFGLPEFLIQHFCAIALDYQNGIFSGADKIIAEVTGVPPMTVQDFVTSHRAAFNTLNAAA
ncbi:NAD-dependent epimerase/dehydratase family protein [Rhizobium ruizarguesonis]|uniref:NAD-dependent epimerase/dehydratase family protein n=1 Tax=Rhizobium ruizarguesonis TaxID=2081791 RepID=A0ABY1WWG5_9HYPH|nr:NmrA family NAD(P)-binding protein [Rhizobium ruizarguesonis]TAU13317.1 NAD-dependent epimerase/dehydratase family protein [Rhizobium ruizarguesonis]TAU60847.1 NAD-dependent epimerase/dehydratase family protein [Rhizobium ruizarguesonis]TAU70338.1 NAD-dependent epimerase/dehydratase family protein [Rhizobium ruizarguesonis]TAV01819.1 NAD-dependent epimerase/dehydratase family protein [Rhizobium ruizarguesonis]TAV19458.1 NAD-dependent epimerase/dehydratase family protein [Rhizobium ruizargue